MVLYHRETLTKEVVGWEDRGKNNTKRRGPRGRQDSEEAERDLRMLNVCIVYARALWTVRKSYGTCGKHGMQE